MPKKSVSQSTFERGFYWNNYTSIESDFLKFLEYTPYHPSNLKVYSPKLTGILLQVGGYVDSAFKEMMNYFDHNRTVENIIDACCIFEEIYNLSSNRGGDLIAKLVFGDKEMHPFKSFSHTERPDWWESYNKVKHEYSLHIKEASMQNVLEGLAGAFLLNVVHYPSIDLLWQLGILETGIRGGDGFAEVHMNEETFDRYMQNATSELKSMNIDIRVETPLFLYVLS